MLLHKTEGVTTTELDVALADLVREVAHTRRPGKLCYTLTIEPNARAGVTLIDEVKITPPKNEKEKSFFYLGDGGVLLRNDPRQAELSLRMIDDAPAAAPKTVNA
ncbi:hypothetical protein [Nibricoccus sp. IMCC34717]|uniref:hypothetical protein n=1 Tax=Nibricoccus sp. IMCC34717 TaxID=3034021 RepID=UPI00384D75DF